MATTEIHAVYSTPVFCLDYVISDKPNRRNEIKDDIADTIGYVERDKVTGKCTVYKTLSTYNNCTKENVLNTFHRLSNKFRHGTKSGNPRTKNGKEVVCWHMHQSFEGHEVSPEIANEIGLKLAKEVFAKFPCVVSTLSNTDNIHNHFVICAWGDDGKKWHDCRRTKRLIRKVSDRLCKEYGLGVLEKTKNMNLTEWTDKDGKKRATEVTDRKIQQWKHHSEGIEPIADSNDYRVSEAYKEQLADKLTNADLVKNDIDSLLPYVYSYDELLEHLQYIGYKINAKKKNGDWLQHVSFTPPGINKPTRDYKLGDNEFYTRQALSDYINKNSPGDIVKPVFNIDDFINNDRPATSEKTNTIPSPGLPVETIPSVDGVKYFEKYDYGEIDLSEINLDYRLCKDSRGSGYISKRSVPEQKTIQAIRHDDAIVRKTYTSVRIKQVIYSINSAHNNKRAYFPKNNTEKLISQIKESCENLLFIEKHNISSYEQVNGLYKTAYTTYNRLLREQNKLTSSISDLRNLATYPDKILELEQSLPAEPADPENVFEYHDSNIAILNRYKSDVAKYSLDTAEGVTGLLRKINEVNSKLRTLEPQLAYNLSELTDYDRCIKILNRIDSSNNERNEGALAGINNNRKSGGVTPQIHFHAHSGEAR